MDCLRCRLVVGTVLVLDLSSFCETSGSFAPPLSILGRHTKLSFLVSAESYNDIATFAVGWKSSEAKRK